jgi:hypothetical protein
MVWAMMACYVLESSECGNSGPLFIRPPGDGVQGGTLHVESVVGLTRVCVSWNDGGRIDTWIVTCSSYISSV